MSDLYCKRCGEPWEYDYVQHEMTEEERENFHKGVCCPSCQGKEIKKRPFRSELASALHEVLGNDLDGLAAEMEDAEYLLGQKFWE